MIVQCSGRFKKFCKGDASLEGECSGWPLEADNDQLKGSSKLIFLLHKKLLKNSTSAILWSFSIWCKLERWKSSISQCLMSWLQIKKIVILKCHLLLLCVAIMNHFSMGLWCAMKSGFYMTTSDNQLGGWTEKQLQSTSPNQTCAKKKSRSLFGGLPPVWSTTAFWIPVEPLYLRNMLSKSVRCTENCNACSWHWSTGWAQFLPWRLLTSHRTTNASKVEQVGHEVLPHPW